MRKSKIIDETKRVMNGERAMAEEKRNIIQQCKRELGQYRRVKFEGELRNLRSLSSYFLKLFKLEPNEKQKMLEFRIFC